MTRWRALIGFVTGVKVRYLILLFLAWNGVCATGLYLNHGEGEIRTTSAGLLAAFALLAIGFTFLGLRQSGSFQEIVLKPSADLEAVESFSFVTHWLLVILGVIFVPVALISAA
jgi:hypothetical protein